MSDAQPTNHSLLQASCRTCLLFLLRENINQLTNNALRLRTRILKYLATPSKLIQDFVVIVCHTCLHFTLLLSQQQCTLWLLPKQFIYMSMVVTEMLHHSYYPKLISNDFLIICTWLCSLEKSKLALNNL